MNAVHLSSDKQLLSGALPVVDPFLNSVSYSFFIIVVECGIDMPVPQI